MLLPGENVALPVSEELEAGLGLPRAQQSSRGTWGVREEASELGNVEIVKGPGATE